MGMYVFCAAAACVPSFFPFGCIYFNRAELPFQYNEIFLRVFLNREVLLKEAVIAAVSVTLSEE